MKTKEQIRIELERWLDRKAEMDMHKTINSLDPYVSHHNDDIFDEYHSDRTMTRDKEWDLIQDGVDVS